MFERLEIKQGDEIELEGVLRRLIDYEYNYTAGIAEHGDFCLRGGLLDIYPVDFEKPVRIELFDKTVESMRVFNLHDGRRAERLEKLLILPKPDVKVARLEKMHFDLSEETAPRGGFFDIGPDDYVVHINHGIGRYRGRRKLKVEKNQKQGENGFYCDFGNRKESSTSEEKTFLMVEYADGDILYVPEPQSHMVRKYIGVESRAPRLSKLGSRAWQKVRARTEEAIGQIAAELLQLQAARASLTGYHFSRDTDWQAKFEKEFPYKDTPDQLISTLQTKKDMEGARPMDRLVCGDVGYGKTEVALRAAFKAVMDYKQVALLVPTTILAQQHYRTFNRRLKNYPVNVQMLSRFKTHTQQSVIIKGMRAGEVDIVIGTHRLLSDDIMFKDLGLVIIDEEQRFGVGHKEKLKQMRLLVDVLTLTATPIPRTLYSSLVGVKDISMITTPPRDRVPIKTCVTYFRDSLIKEVIERELNRGGQVYFVHNRIESIAKEAEHIQRLVPKAKLATGHGRMSPSELEQIMMNFINGKIDVLISTTIIESGLDIPNVNTIIVNRADMFGLADLYQLRGRVGRSKQQAYAYFFIPQGKELNPVAQKRLEAIEKFTELGAGFKVAMKDLEIRGAGNLLGHEQSGYIYAVGFDLYCKMIKEAVKSQGSGMLAKSA